VTTHAQWTTATLKVRFRTVDGVRIRYADSEGPYERTVLLTSPWPESLYAFAPMWTTLAERARLFGRAWGMSPSLRSSSRSFSMMIAA
jgi:hypothetical protein